MADIKQMISQNPAQLIASLTWIFSSGISSNLYSVPYHFSFWSAISANFLAITPILLVKIKM